MSSPLYTGCIELLLSEEVICKQRYEDYFVYLDDSRNRDEINQYLSVLHRTVRTTSDLNAYFCCYTEISDPAVKLSCKQTFREVVDSLQPLVEWLCLLMDLDPSGSPLKPGDHISKGALLTKLDQSSVLAETLISLSKNKRFGSSASTLDGSLSYVLMKLTEWGYLEEFGHTKTRYRATGKWSILYDQMGFIKLHEHIEDPEDISQGALL